MDESTQWWLMAGVLVVAELATGTFYLLMIALGAVAGALAAHAGLGTEVQLSAAAVVAALTAGGWYAWKRRPTWNWIWARWCKSAPGKVMAPPMCLTVAPPGVPV